MLFPIHCVPVHCVPVHCVPVHCVPYTVSHTQVELCQQCIDWATSENRVFLRQALEARLVALHVDRDSHTQALAIANPLLKELKKIDDKALLVEVLHAESESENEELCLVL